MDQLVYNLKHSFMESMDDDFNIAPALAALFQFTREINRIMDRTGLADEDKSKIKDALEGINSVLDIIELEPVLPDQNIEKLLDKREHARKAKDWITADKIRQDLLEKGIEVIDTKDRPIWRRVK
jgi:cysteinyl-tRNA synthetase